MNRKELERIFLEIISEDEGYSDITSNNLPSKTITARIISQNTGFLSGSKELDVLFDMFNIRVLARKTDGDKIKNGDVVFKLRGNSKDILLIERTALNIISRMSGITTLTKEYVDFSKEINPKVRIAMTRKTTPLFRYFEKEAVRAGGGDTHRFGLYDMILIKNNHLKLFNNVRACILAVKAKKSFVHKIEIEVKNQQEATEAIEGGVDIIMFDNMLPGEIKKTTDRINNTCPNKNVLFEASGNINLENIREYLLSGVDIISLGRLTHSLPVSDFNLRID